ncbi:hypothetical protein A3A84_01015 [Candidatus Collierbacteria bacterium RIFCSPLOWO2_01_FULL_50_23]|uniref:Uncharacterized protein n=2 Tax=Candidatus Collieribacteriota TaxID=1752725 RepID=A0A1F5ERD0_9BACT|nr:MAG: hypothetical protein A3D09_01765 [Candidatus Collierbacteria bacterium RIFCSPHIGHO2_02_FULL_49_10]OGD71366.1 MAG: hypothetical protein A2703_03560 [Candidatus Collierbacteria bacterium RIFCSPHIGHO2_01_FULL_50_25]OGD74033.1 MAG: hypothetical protein A3A84_01015 [Candidatus Collierbacteria bacterium RIFCSPLOWO2_01_FULL_50_23]
MDEDFKTTTSHVVIRGWAENHGGKPALIVDPNQFDLEVGLRVDFPGKQDEALLSRAHHNQDVSWDEFFKVFEEQQLAFDYLEEPGETDLVDAYRFIKREALKDKEVKSLFDPAEFDRAIRGGQPPFAVHDGEVDNPQQGEVESVVPDDVQSEQGSGGDTPDLTTDDDTTKEAAGAGYLEKDDPQAKHDQD